MNWTHSLCTLFKWEILSAAVLKVLSSTWEMTSGQNREPWGKGGAVGSTVSMCSQYAAHDNL